jgi:hypothetical protein
MEHPTNASQSIEPACSEINPTNALPHIPRVALRELGRSIRDLPRLRADDGQTGSYSESEGSLWEVATTLSTCLCSRVLGNVKSIWAGTALIGTLTLGFE